MIRELHKVKSEVLDGRIATRINSGRCKTALRFSRRVRHLPPEYIDIDAGIRNGLGKQILSQELSFQLWPSGKLVRRKLHYLRKRRQSKQVINMLSASRSSNKKLSVRKRTMALTKGFGNNFLKPKLLSLRSLSNSSVKIETKNSPGTCKILNKRKQYVLEVLNKGDLREIVKLPTVGSKTAEMIVLFRELKGCISRISDLAKMPKFPKRRFHSFVVQNFLTTD